MLGLRPQYLFIQRGKWESLRVFEASDLEILPICMTYDPYSYKRKVSRPSSIRSVAVYYARKRSRLDAEER